MISTEAGYEDWLEQRRVAFEAQKETLTKEPTESGAKKEYCVFCRTKEDWVGSFPRRIGYWVSG